MGDQVQREVERRDGGNDAHRTAEIESDPAFTGGAGVHRHGLAMDAFGFFGCELEGLNPPRNLPEEYFQALPASRQISVAISSWYLSRS